MAPSGTTAEMVQSGQRFRPFVLPIQVGTTVEFPNRDPFRHHVYSFSASKTFELKLYDSSEAEKVTFDKEGAIPLGCNIHDNMLAYIYVVGTPHFELSSDEGLSVIENLPAGDYTVEAWHPNARASDPIKSDVNIPASGISELNLTLDLKRSRRQRDPGAFDEDQY